MVLAMLILDLRQFWKSRSLNSSVWASACGAGEKTPTWPTQKTPSRWTFATCRSGRLAEEEADTALVVSSWPQGPAPDATGMDVQHACCSKHYTSLRLSAGTATVDMTQRPTGQSQDRLMDYLQQCSLLLELVALARLTDEKLGQA